MSKSFGKDLTTGRSVLEIGTHYLRIVGSSYICFSIMFVANGVINGSGHTMITMVFSLVMLWLIRVPLAGYLSHTALKTDGIWIALDTSFFVSMSASLVYYFTGKWKKIVIKKTNLAVNVQDEPMI